MSIQDLEARIEELSSDIERQKDILRKLEHDKSLVQRQLNDVRDPVARLPPEISSEIFMQCLPSCPLPEADQAPMLLSNVCNTWTSIALSTPALWSRISVPEDLEFLTAEAFTTVVEQWLRRAGTHLLDITMETPLDSIVASVLTRYSSRLQCLDICVRSDEDSEEEEEEDPDLFNITQWPEPQLPLLRSLIFRPSKEDGGDEFSAAPILHLVRAAPELTELSVNALYLTARDTSWTADVVLPNLKRFEYGYEAPSNLDKGVLKYLSAPRLEFFHISEVEQPSVVSFLQRSSPPLKEVVVEFGPPAPQLLDHFLSLLSSVTILKFMHLGKAAAESFFNILAEEQSGVLPNLQTLKLPDMPEWSDWNMVLRALSARRTVLRTVHLSRYNRDWVFPDSFDAEVRAGFSQLVADGMGVRIDIKGGEAPDENVVQLFPIL